MQFCREVLGVEPWGRGDGRDPEQDGQREVLEALFADGGSDVAARGGRGTSKSMLAALAILAWLETREDSLVFLTAPGGDQVSDNVWKEVRSIFRESSQPLLGRILPRRPRIDIGDRWFALGRSTNDPHRALGYHAPGGVLVVVDDASGVEEAIYEALAGMDTGGKGARLLLGNPTRRSGSFHGAFQAGSAYAQFHLDAERCPEWLVSDRWLSARRSEWGPDYQDNPLYQCYVRGEFATDSERALIPMRLLEANESGFPGFGGRHMGVDIARMGGDRSVALLLDQGRVTARHEWSHADTPRSVAIIARLIKTWKVDPSCVHVDASGGSVGAGVYDYLRHADLEVDGVEFGGSPLDDQRQFVGPSMGFRNRRAELYYGIRCRLQEGCLAIPRRYAKLWGDLVAIEWEPEDGLVKIAPKDQIKKLIGRSTDDSDALACAIARSSTGAPSIAVVR